MFRIGSKNNNTALKCRIAILEQHAGGINRSNKMRLLCKVYCYNILIVVKPTSTISNESVRQSQSIPYKIFAFHDLESSKTYLQLDTKRFI